MLVTRYAQASPDLFWQALCQYVARCGPARLSGVHSEVLRTVPNQALTRSMLRPMQEAEHNCCNCESDTR